MNKKYKHAGQVWARVVQIIQEAMLMGVDCVDLLRQIEVCEDPEAPGTLVLTHEYASQIEKMHATWLKNALELQASEENEKSEEELVLSVGSKEQN